MVYEVKFSSILRTDRLLFPFHYAGPWAPVRAQFPCGVHRPVAPAERQVPPLPVLRLPQPRPERAQQPPAILRAGPAVGQRGDSGDDGAVREVVAAGWAELPAAATGASAAAGGGSAWRQRRHGERRRSSCGRRGDCAGDHRRRGERAA